jgi:putative DNA primase/helicase
MSAADIAKALGNTQRSGGWWRCRCPVHGSAGATLALRDGERGLIVYCHTSCRRDDIFAELHRLGLVGANAVVSAAAAPSDPAAEQFRRQAEAASRQRQISLARDIWQSALPATGTVVERYLRERRITIPVPITIRFIGMNTAYPWHPASGQRRPVLVAAVEHVEHGLVGVIRTFLAIDGSCKATLDPPRLFTGPVAGGAVRLGELRPDLPLIIAEGVESALAASELFGGPAWAALSAGGIERLILPPEARDIFVAIDRDRNGTGERAARRAAQRWVRQGRRVRLLIPDRIGADPNDLLRQAGYAA